MITQNSVKFLQLKIAAFTVDDLICDDGTYHLQLIDDKGELSSSIFRIQPGGGYTTHQELSRMKTCTTKKKQCLYQTRKKLMS